MEISIGSHVQDLMRLWQRPKRNWIHSASAFWSPFQCFSWEAAELGAEEVREQPRGGVTTPVFTAGSSLSFFRPVTMPRASGCFFNGGFCHTQPLCPIAWLVEMLRVLALHSGQLVNLKLMSVHLMIQAHGDLPLSLSPPPCFPVTSPPSCTFSCFKIQQGSTSVTREQNKGGEGRANSYLGVRPSFLAK